MKKHLLISLCMNQKMPYTRAARHVYKGLIRTLSQRIPQENSPIDVYIISAKLGLINWDTIIEPYNQMMTRERAVELAPTVSQQIRELLDSGRYADCLSNLGGDYLIAAGNGFRDSPIPVASTLDGGGGPMAWSSRLFKWVDERTDGKL